MELASDHMQFRSFCERVLVLDEVISLDDDETMSGTDERSVCVHLMCVYVCAYVRIDMYVCMYV